nr:hypothetical protein CFP56_66186 [Quercus suber]
MVAIGIVVAISPKIAAGYWCVDEEAVFGGSGGYLGGKEGFGGGHVDEYATVAETREDTGGGQKVDSKRFTTDSSPLANIANLPLLALRSLPDTGASMKKQSLEEAADISVARKGLEVVMLTSMPPWQRPERTPEVRSSKMKQMPIPI